MYLFTLHVCVCVYVHEFFPWFINLNIIIVYRYQTIKEKKKFEDFPMFNTVYISHIINGAFLDTVTIIIILGNLQTR